MAHMNKTDWGLQAKAVMRAGTIGSGVTMDSADCFVDVSQEVGVR